jgi:predicted MFS family arabinose efflux permease
MTEEGKSERVPFILYAALLSKLGNQLLIIAIPLAILTKTGSQSTALLAYMSQTLPFMASPILGVIIDRYDRRRLLSTCEGLQLVCITGISFAARGPNALVIVPLLIASFAGVISSTVVGYILLPALVPANRLPAVNSFYNGGSQLIAVIGLPLGVAVFTFSGVRATLLIDAATFVATMLGALLIPRHRVPSGIPKPAFSALVEGWRYVRADGILIRLAATLGLCNLGGGCLSILVLTMARFSWHWGSGWTGLAIGTGAVGSAAGAALGGRSVKSQRANMMPGLVLVVIGGAVMVPLTGSPLLLIGYVILSVGAGFTNVRSVLFRQLRIPAELSGRVNALLRTVIFGAGPLSAAIQLPLVGEPFWVRMLVPASLVMLALLLWAPTAIYSGHHRRSEDVVTSGSERMALKSATL